MKQYIDKSALVAELNRLIAELVEEGENTMFEQGRISAFEDAKLFLNTLKVKGAGLENSVKVRIDYPFINVDFPNIYINYKELKDYCYKNGIKDEDEVKIILIND